MVSGLVVAIVSILAVYGMLYLLGREILSNVEHWHRNRQKPVEKIPLGEFFPKIALYTVLITVYFVIITLLYVHFQYGISFEDILIQGYGHPLTDLNQIGRQ